MPDTAGRVSGTVYGRSYSSLHVASLTPEAHAQTCNYWYTVTNGAVAHTAFTTRAGLDRWLGERNLALKAELPAPGTFGRSAIIGSYREHSHIFDPENWEAPDGINEPPEARS